MSLISHNSQGEVVMWFNCCAKKMKMLSGVISAHHCCTFITFFCFWLIIVSRMSKERTCQDIRMIQLSANTSHINNGLGYQNVGVVMGVSSVQYSGSYGAIVLVQAVHIILRLIMTRLFNFQLHIMLFIIHNNSKIIGQPMVSHVI